MSGGKHNAENQGAKLRDHAHRRGPFWKRAHRDWRVWLVVLLMLLMMFVYVRTEDLSWRPGQSSGPRMPAANLP
jgi:hypothetical protein